MITRFLVLFFAISILSGAWAKAEKRLALVVGVAEYATGALDNPVNDAQLVAGSLEQSGFDVTLLTDISHREMKTAISDFGQQLRSAGPDTVALFYFAGHGVQLEGRNFLIPTPAEIRSIADVEYASIDAQWVLDIIGEAGPRLSIVILDACRNNPFRSLSRSARQGLAQMDAPRGSLLAYSTGPGAVAFDGDGAHSPYSAALAEEMLRPGLKIEEVFKNVRRRVLHETGDEQVPWETSSLIGDFYFSGSADASTPGQDPVSATAQSGLAPGETFRDCPNCPEMVVIPGGSFEMGAPSGDFGNGTVDVSVEPFALSRTEVTRASFAQFVEESGHDIGDGCWWWSILWHFDGGRTWNNPGFAQEDDHPVVCTTYGDAQAYADWLGERTGVRYRLPSEAEWEYAGGAGQGSAPWGTNPDLGCADANIHDVQGATTGMPLSSAGCDDGFVETAPVASMPANAFGLFDMMGNGWEMIDDCYNGSHPGRPAEGGSRTTGDCNLRIYKGSHFLNYRESYIPQHRFAGIGSQPNIYGGFRVARDLN